MQYRVRCSPQVAAPAMVPRGDDDVFTAPEGVKGTDGTKKARPKTRIDWATLLRRVWGVDALATRRPSNGFCERAGGARRWALE